jgi:long-chain acyl-CoA synthetase
MESFISRFKHQLEDGDKTLKIIFENDIYDQNSVEEYIKKFAIFLSNQGVGDRDRVVIISKNRPYFLFAVFGAMYLGAVPVLVEESQAVEDLFYLTKGEPYVITDRSEIYPNKKVFYFENILESIKNLNVSKYNSLKTPNETVDEDQTLIILHSSGTTGHSKKVHYSEKNVLWADGEYYRLYDFEHNDIFAYILPVNCTLGIIACGLTPMSHKKEIVFMDRSDLDWALRSIEKHRVNVLAGIPLMYKYMVRLDLSKYDFSSVRVCDSGGEILPIAIIKKFQEGSGVTITEGYGQTETTSLTHFLVPDKEGKLRIGSIGSPCNEVECKIVDEYGHQVKIGEIGELLVRGPMVMKGYDDPELTKLSLTEDGWFVTGDMVYRDSDDYYYIVSRKKDLNNATSKSGLLMKEMEEKLYAIEDIVEATILMDQNSDVRIFVKPGAKINLDLNGLLKSIKNELSKISLKILDIKFVDSLPRTATGKVKRRLIN